MKKDIAPELERKTERVTIRQPDATRAGHLYLVRAEVAA
jgi:hypothetical protein